MSNDDYNVDKNREETKDTFDLSGSVKVFINGQEYIKFTNPETKEISLREINGNNVIEFINVVDILNNRDFYQSKLNSLNKEQAEIYRYMIVNNKNLGLTKINIEKGIGIDNKGKIIAASMNPLTSEISSKEAEITKETFNNQELVDGQDMEKSQQKQYVYKLEDKKAGFLDMAYYPTLIIIAILIMVIIVVVGVM